MRRSRDALTRRYASQQRVLFLCEMAITIAFLAAITWSGAWLHIRQTITLPYPYSIVLLFSILLAAQSLLSLPVSYYKERTAPARLGLSLGDTTSWLGAKARESFFEWAVGSITAVAVYALLSRAPDWWWLIATMITALVSALLTFLGPRFVLPSMFRLKPLPPGELQQRLADLAARAGFQPIVIYSMDWSRRGAGANAMFLGMGHSKRVVLADTLIRDYSLEEIETVLGHELGHYRKRHVLKLFLFQSGFLLSVLLFTHIALNSVVAAGGPFTNSTPSDPASLPLLVLLMLAFGLALAPAFLAFNRRLELQSDLFGLELTRNPGAFIQALSRMHWQNLAETDPSRAVELLFYDHPPLAKRIALAREFERNISRGDRSGGRKGNS